MTKRKLQLPTKGCLAGYDEPLRLDAQKRKSDPTYAVHIARRINFSRIRQRKGRPEQRLSSNFNLVPIDEIATPGKLDRATVRGGLRGDVLGLQEIIRSECTREKSRSCVTSAAALIANALAA
jgi:hypothetical protein